MADIFGRQEQVFAGGLTSDASWMFWSGLPNGGLGLLVTQMSIQYQQPIRRIYEIGPWTMGVSIGSSGSVSPGSGVSGISISSGQPVYYIAGRPEGTIQISRIAGFTATLGSFYRSYGNVCSLSDLFFVSGAGCDVSGGGSASATVTTGVSPSSATVAGTNPATHRYGFLGWYCTGVVINGLSLGAQAQDMMVIENLSFMFACLKLYSSTTGTGGWTAL